MEFRRTVVSDSKVLTRMRLAMRRERESLPPPEDEAAFEKAVEEYFLRAIVDGSYIGIIAEEGGEPAGTGGICLHNHPPSYALPDGKSACLLNMYTLPGFRGRGVAGRILFLLVRCAAEMGCRKVFLNASAAGKPLYRKFGFTDVADEMEYVIPAGRETKQAPSERGPEHA